MEQELLQSPDAIVKKEIVEMFEKDAEYVEVETRILSFSQRAQLQPLKDEAKRLFDILVDFCDGDDEVANDCIRYGCFPDECENFGD
jgi:hypothetical protein